MLLYLTDLRMTGRSMLQKCAAGSLVLTAVEFVAGCIINRGCRLGVWDYSRRREPARAICPLQRSGFALHPVLPLSRALRDSSARAEAGGSRPPDG
ncbi:MAG: hypothetical protein ACLVL7_09440 [Anaerotruncus massiliensis (ex Togo et al. 2019)]